MDPLRVDPGAAPENAVRVMKRTLLRHADAIAADPQDDELARLIVAVVIAALRVPAELPADGMTLEAGPARTGQPVIDRRGMQSPGAPGPRRRPVAGRDSGCVPARPPG